MIFKRLLIGCAASLCCVGSVHAQLGQNLFMGNAKALALGNAVTADPPGIDSIHFNPAGLVKLKGRQKHLKLVLGQADVRADFIANEEYLELIESTPGLDSDPSANTSSEIENFAVYLPGLGITEVPFIAAPLGGVSYSPPGSDITFATAAYSPLVLGYTRAEDDPGINYAREIGIARITYLSPTVGWQVTDTFSVGAGIAISYMGVGLNLDYRAPNVSIGAISSFASQYCESIEQSGGPFEGICADDASISPFEKFYTLEADVDAAFSPTYNLGFLWEPTPWFSWGFVYQSEAVTKLEGDLSLEVNPDLVRFFGGIVKDGDVIEAAFNRFFSDLNQELFIDGGKIDRKGSVEVTMPQHIATGISLRLFPSLKVNVDVKWTETSKWKELEFKFEDPVALLGLLSGKEGVSENNLAVPRGYEDALNMALGIEYQYNDRLALRVGWEPRKSGIPDDKLDFLVPLGDFDLYGLGFEYIISPDQVFDFAIGYGKVDEYIATGDSTNGNDLRSDNYVYNPSAGLDVQYTTEFLLVELNYSSTF